MERFSPKIELINHFDNLVQQIDIDIDACLSKYYDDEVIGEVGCFQLKNRLKYIWGFTKIDDSNDDNRQQTSDNWPESTKVADYLTQIRMRTIEELRNEQKQSVENSSRFNSESLTKEEKRSELFAEKFYFQVRVKNPRIKSWLFDLFTFVADFYMSQSEIDLLEKLINTSNPNEIRPHVFDERTLLICLVYESFYNNLKNQTFPSHVIKVFKQDVSKIKYLNIATNISSVEIAIDLSNLEELNITNSSANLDHIIIDGLWSLKYLRVCVNSVKDVSLKQLYGLERLELITKESVNLEPDLLDHLPNIEKLSYQNGLMTLEFEKFDKRVNLRNVCFANDANFGFLIDIFRNRIKKLLIKEFDLANLYMLFGDYEFPTLLSLNISLCTTLTRIEKPMFMDSLPSLRTLDISKNCRLEEIEFDAFSNLKRLVSITLRENSIRRLDRNDFFGLDNLKEFNFSPKKPPVRNDVRFLEEFGCDICRERFDQPSQLERHRKSHIS